MPLFLHISAFVLYVNLFFNKKKYEQVLKYTLKNTIIVLNRKNSDAKEAFIVLTQSYRIIIFT